MPRYAARSAARVRRFSSDGMAPGCVGSAEAVSNVSIAVDSWFLILAARSHSIPAWWIPVHRSWKHLIFGVAPTRFNQCFILTQMLRLAPDPPTASRLRLESGPWRVYGHGQTPPAKNYAIPELTWWFGEKMWKMAARLRGHINCIGWFTKHRKISPSIHPNNSSWPMYSDRATLKKIETIRKVNSV
jgi:hypothetical protein